MDEVAKLIEAVRKYRALRAARAARWGEGNARMRRSRPAAKDWDEYPAATGALVAAHKEVFRAALALEDAAPVDAGDVVSAPLRGGGAGCELPDCPAGVYIAPHDRRG